MATGAIVISESEAFKQNLDDDEDTEDELKTLTQSSTYSSTHPIDVNVVSATIINKEQDIKTVNNDAFSPSEEFVEYYEEEDKEKIVDESQIDTVCPKKNCT